MLHIRKVKTRVGSMSIQVFRYERGKRIILKHIGTGNTESEILALKELARCYIRDLTNQNSLFNDDKDPSEVILLNQCKYLGFYYSFLYEALDGILVKLGYASIIDRMLLDLVIMRIIEPTSKLRSIDLMKQYFGINHRRQRYYESALNWTKLKDRIEERTLEFARKEYGLDMSLLFYDVTTLYFETFESDQLRKNGFSKDNKSQQPQILVALLVSKEGFPIAYEVFSGNTYEGHTIIPVIESFIQKHEVNHFTVIADAAMLSVENILKLQSAKINYIVGARLGNVNHELLKLFDSNLMREDGRIIRLKSEHGYLICSYCTKRYKKDKYEMDKQIERAKLMLGQHSKSSKVKFLKTEEAKIRLNEELIIKTTKLLGIKGYYTDLEESIVGNTTIIQRYHDLYKIEQAFRLTKSDLKTRPIFHFKEEPIKLHVLVCFMALAVAKHIEIKGNISIRSFITQGKAVTDARMLNKISKEIIKLRTEVPQTLTQILQKITRPD